MTGRRAKPADPLIELGDLTLHVARKLRGYLAKNPEIASVSPLECLVLLHVSHHPGVSPSSLAQELALSTSNTATAVRSLVRKGQLERRPSSSDGRAVHLHLTADAEHATTIVHRIWRERLAPADVSAADLQVTIRTLAAINAAAVEP